MVTVCTSSAFFFIGIISFLMYLIISVTIKIRSEIPARNTLFGANPCTASQCTLWKIVLDLSFLQIAKSQSILSLFELSDIKLCFILSSALLLFFNIFNCLYAFHVIVLTYQFDQYLALTNQHSYLQD